jgi:uncharacterized protein
MRFKSKNAPGMLVLGGILVLAVLILVKKPLDNRSQAEDSSQSSNSFFNNLAPNLVTQILPSPSPLPFADMTVPYLRQREYQSQLGELNSYQNNANYISYLTNYSSDGLKINGLLTRPKGEMPPGGWPAIVFIHGYIAPTIYRTTEKYEDYVNYLARNGFVVFKIDLRGHGDSEGEAGGAYYSSDYIIDALNARAALQASGFVNPDKVGLWGHSMAGNVVLRSMAVKPEIPASVIWGGAVYTYSDMQQYGIDDNSYRPPAQSAQRTRRRQELFDTHGQFSVDSPFWQQVAATNYLNDMQGALEIHHAVNDDVVSINYSRDLMKLMDGTAVPHQLHEYQSGGHNISGGSFTQAMQRTVEFFKEKL